MAQLNEAPRLKSEEEFTNGLIDIGNRMYWMLLSPNIKADLERQAARHKREEAYGRAQQKTA